MEPALPSPLRLRLEHAPIEASHDDVSASIQVFLASYAARTGAQTSTADDATALGAGGSTASTGGVVASQLTRLMNGLAGKVDYAAFAQLISDFTDPEASASVQPSGLPIPPTVDMDVESVTDFSPPASVSPTSPQPSQSQTADADADQGEMSFSRQSEQQEPHNNASPSDVSVQPSQHSSKKHKKDKKADKKSKKIKKET